MAQLATRTGKRIAHDSLGKQLLSSALFIIILSPVLRAGTAEYQVTISAGDQTRHNVPVCIPLPATSPTAKSVILIGPDGKRIPAQLTSPRLLASKDCGDEIHFLLHHLNAGETLSLSTKLSEDPLDASVSFVWHDRAGDHVDLVLGEKPVLTYYYHRFDASSEMNRERTYKVFHNLYSPSGDRVVTNGLPPEDGSQIHSPHHRGLFYGFNRINYGGGKTVDLWHCPKGYQEHNGFLVVEAGPIIGRHRMIVRWHGEDHHEFAEEQRELTAYNVPGGRLFEFASRLRSLQGPVRLDGDSHHAGFQFRAHIDVDTKTTQETIYVRPDGVGKPGETRNWDPQTRQGPINLPWNSMSFVLDGKRYTAAYLDHPKNPKDSIFSEREFGRFGSFFAGEFDETKTLDVDYRIWLQDGLITPDDVARLSGDFVEPVKVAVTAR